MEDAIKYREAYQHYQRAIQLNPESAEYLETAASIAGILADHQQQLIWSEQALVIYTNKMGVDHRNTITIADNLARTKSKQ